MTTSKAVARRERRIAARRAQILEAAAEVFKQKGYDRATTREIADVADVSEGTLYNYFGSKRDILIGLIEEFIEQTTEDITNIQADSPEELMNKILVRRFQVMQERRMFAIIVHEARIDPEIHDYYLKEGLLRIKNQLEQVIQAMIAAGVVRPVDPNIAARTLIAATMGFAVQLDLQGDDVHVSKSPDILAASVTDILLHGLLAKPTN
jgi:AcrR family transcriptional regulator